MHSAMLPAMTLRLVVLGTGTDVGKTHVARELARSAQQAFRSTLALKPIETGVPQGAVGNDASTLWTASGRVSAPPAHAYSFEPAISAHLAARQVGGEIDPGAVANWVERQEEAGHGERAAEHALTIVETAGGVFSPVTSRLTNLDLAEALEPAAWLLVAPDSLGVLHDVKACLLAMSSVGRGPDFLMLSASRPADASTGANAAELRRLDLPVPVACFGRDLAPPDLSTFWTSLRFSFPSGNAQASSAGR